MLNKTCLDKNSSHFALEFINLPPKIATAWTNSTLSNKIIQNFWLYLRETTLSKIVGSHSNEGKVRREVDKDICILYYIKKHLGLA